MSTYDATGPAYEAGYVDGAKDHAKTRTERAVLRAAVRWWRRGTPDDYQRLGAAIDRHLAASRRAKRKTGGK